VPAFDKRGFVYIRKSDEYPGNHPDWGIMKDEGFTVPLVRPPEVDPKAIETVKSARKAGLYPALWEVPKKLPDESREKPIAFADRLNKIIGDMDAAGAYTFAYVADNEQLPVEWHEEFAPYMAGKRTRAHILSIDPQQGSMWDTRNIYAPYIKSGWSIDIQCYGAKMEYFDVMRCVGVVLGTPGVPSWKVRVTVPPTDTEQILTTLTKMWPMGVGIYAPSFSQVVNELPKYGDYISNVVNPPKVAYK
jgi:hypothetical protein